MHCLEPTTLGLGAIGAAIEKVHQTARNLTFTLSKAIFGQHLVTKMFSWFPGTGKNYVAKFIADAMYPDTGLKNPHFHLIISTIHFPIPSQSYEYKSQVQNWIKGNITNCQRSVFVFDEVDKMPPNVIDGIKPFIDFHEDIDGIDFRKAIFIFLGNTGAKKINERVNELSSQGTKREDISYEALESLVSKGAFNEDGGLKKSNIIGQHLVDHYIPFLPLERKHVRMCIEKELGDRNENLPDSKIIQILNSLNYWPDRINGPFCTSGCKMISKKIDIMLMDG
ncbi:TOR1 [Lepeophtheirus salmonis]|uniref:TOR1 n=1 Tax=Lepeophtheirus salmonis TaxID=72036 RepID=A0A7R8CW18_LEPSM|nr:TOR1 [Lepeophtheirus salmonis]CAF2949437.1 TOR1 [Lepeophtheirus salmonis]